MDKKEYLKNRFKRDFLQYSLLQEDSLPAKEIAEKLYGVIDLNWLIGQETMITNSYYEENVLNRYREWK